MNARKMNTMAELLAAVEAAAEREAERAAAELETAAWDAWREALESAY